MSDFGRPDPTWDCDPSQLPDGAGVELLRAKGQWKHLRYLGRCVSRSAKQWAAVGSVEYRRVWTREA